MNQPKDIENQNSVSAGKDLATVSSEELAAQGDGQSSVSFTPGPWEVDLTVRGSHPSYLEVSAVNDASWLARVQTYWDARKESEANARLIAAAPSLYEALKQLYEARFDVAGTPRQEIAFESARAALAAVVHNEEVK